MKNKHNKLYGFALILLSICFAGCTKDFNQQPLNANTSEIQYSTPAGYKEVLAKVYGSYSLVSSTGVGNSDINFPGITDAGTTDFLRAYWNMQELTTDEAVCAWNDAQLLSFHNLNWTSSNIYIGAMYTRSLYQITVCNEFIRQSTDELLAKRGIKGQDLEDVHRYRAEARYLRAFQYWVLMDLFGNPPFVTEKDPIGKFIPKQIQRKDLFDYIVSELKDIDGALAAPHTNEYGRVDQAADWALLARIYLNANIYTGTNSNDYYTNAITYASKVIGAGYSLMPTYKNLFKSDNNLNNPEVILPIAYDGVNASNYGGTTFLICSAHGTDPTDNKAYGIPSGGWLGNRSTKNLPDLFSQAGDTEDSRALFGPGSADINDILVFNEGESVYKFDNTASNGSTPPSPDGVLCSTDFPLFRLAEMYLIYAEAVARGGQGGSTATALGYLNLLRARAYGGHQGDLTSYDLNTILDERGRELYWEGFRRTDLIRFGKFSGNNYLWPWKGGVKAGVGKDSHFNLFPIPASEIISNTNLQQNEGY